jgi:hypothetical protein
MAQQAQDTFVALLDDGSERLVAKGEVLPDSHELVKRDQKGSGTLFRPLNLEGDDAPAKARPTAQAPAPKTPPKAAGNG